MKNSDIAQVFAQVATLLEIRGDNIHRVLSYKRAAENLGEYPEELTKLSAAGELTSIPGIGKALAEKIQELIDSGRLTYLDNLAEEIPLSILELLKIEGMGPKRVKLVYQELGVKSLDELDEAAKDGSLATLPKMGQKSVDKIIAGIQALKSFGTDRVKLGEALPLAEEILEKLQKLPAVTNASIAGSVRRRKETIGDIDLLVATDDPEAVMSTFTTLGPEFEVALNGPTKSRIVKKGLGIDLRVLPAENWGTLISYFTGSQAHNVRLRERAKAMGLSLNEYAFSKIDSDEKILCPTEEDVYRVLELAWVPPELREDKGEIEAAENDSLPQLITLDDIRGDLHMHTTWSDGSHTVLEMAQAAIALGREYICITDHSYSLGIANGLNEERILAQHSDIQQVRDQLGDQIHILHGTEMEVRNDGRLDFEDDLLESLDFVIAAVHTGLSQPRQQVTDRMLGAIENPHVDMIAHPTGRLIGRRTGGDFDMSAIIEAAARTGTILEINAHPSRLDLKDTYVRMALEHGVKLAINTDAHHVDQQKLMHFGVSTGRRGWAEPKNIVNSWAYDDLIQSITM